MTADTWLALIAIAVSLISILLQYTVEGPSIELLNVQDVQYSVPRLHKNLPQDIQEKYPDIRDAQPGYALVKLVFGNSGDRAGIANIQDITATIIASGETPIKPVCEKYILVPAYAIVTKEILLRNVQISENEVVVEIKLKIEYGGYNPRSTKYTHRRTIQNRICVNLVPANEAPPLGIF